jgi:hypothetical protein
MPFATYTIEKRFLENFKEIKFNNLSKFNTDVEDFNCNQKAILIENTDIDIKKYLAKIIIQISNNNNMNISLMEKKILLENTLHNLNQSIFYKATQKESREIVVDFKKNTENEINRDFKNQIIDGSYYPEDFENDTNKFTENFLGKIKIFINSKSKTKNDKIHILYIYHKELSNFLMPDEQSIFAKSILEYKNNLSPKIKKEKERIENIRKIEYGINLLYKWWGTIPKEIRPKFKILTDIPASLKKYAYHNKMPVEEKNLILIEEKFQNFLFLKNTDDKNTPKVKLIWQRDMPGHMGWKHKRHWIFGTKFNPENEVLEFLAIKSDFGVEIVDANNNSKLSPEMELKVITNKNVKQMRDITEYLKQDANKENI